MAAPLLVTKFRHQPVIDSATSDPAPTTYKDQGCPDVPFGFLPPNNDPNVAWPNWLAAFALVTAGMGPVVGDAVQVPRGLSARGR